MADQVPTPAISSLTVPGPGGGGGRRRDLVLRIDVFPATVSASANGGINGVVSPGNTKAACRGASNGALPGNAGISQANYIVPQSTVDICVVLASTVLNYFNGILTDAGSLLSWGLTVSDQSQDVQSFTIERSVDQVHFLSLVTITASTDSLNYHYTDPATFDGTAYYRLTWVDKHGLRSYSRIIALTRPTDPFAFVQMHPNPVADQLSVELFSRNIGSGALMIFNAQGQRLARYPLNLHTGANTLLLPVSQLAPGAYFLVAEAKNRHQVTPFIKK